MRLSPLLVLLLLLLGACDSYFCTWSLGYRPVAKKPARKKIIGFYELDRTSKDFLKNKGFKNDMYTLELKSNGQFILTNGPDLIFAHDERSKRALINKKGKWQVSCAGLYNCFIELEKVCVVPLAEKDNRFAVLIQLGNEDECKGLVYRQIK